MPRNMRRLPGRDPGDGFFACCDKIRIARK